VAIAWFAGIAASLLALPLANTGNGAADQPTGYLVATLVFQSVGVVASLVLISHVKGQASLRRDFGLVWPLQRLAPAAAAAWVLAGAAVSVAAQILLVPVSAVADLDDPAQQVSRSLQDANGVGRLLFALGVVFLAPPVEELLFRGALLRGLQRRWSVPVAVFASATVFAGIHVVADPGAIYVVPGVMLLGLVAGATAARHGDLARPVLLHMGFNLLGALGLLLT
jgi:membrane protease YdiL (CAAX protease family)